MPRGKPNQGWAATFNDEEPAHAPEDGAVSEPVRIAGNLPDGRRRPKSAGKPPRKRAAAQGKISLAEPAEVVKPPDAAMGQRKTATRRPNVKKPSTAGWTPEFRNLVMADVLDKVEHTEICLKHHITMGQLDKLIVRQRHIAAHEKPNIEREEYLKDVSQEIMVGNLQAIRELRLSPDVPPDKKAAELRKQAESHGIISVAPAKTPPGNTINISGNAQFNLSTQSDDQLAERAIALARRIRGRRPSLSSGTPSDRAGVAEEGEEQDLESVPGRGAAAPGTVRQAH